METLEKLRFLIDKEIVSRYELAKDLGMSKSTLTNYYEGKTTPSSLRLDVIETYINKRFGSNLNCSLRRPKRQSHSTYRRSDCLMRSAQWL